MTWELVAFGGLALVLIGGFAWYERAHPPARLIALVAVLAALAVAGRLVLAPVPNVVATTDIALITGYALGPAPGFAVGALAAPISNIWLGQGPWTAWQMAGWGLAGLTGAWLALATRRRLGRFGLAAACGIAGLAFGALLDLSVMVTYGGEQSLDRYLALSARGLPFNIAHALGNIAFALAAGPALVRMISRYRTRLEFAWHPAGALPLLLVVLALVGLVRSPTTEAEPSAASWLVAAQGEDGGFGAGLDFDSSPAMTGWVMMGLEAAGQNPLDLTGNAPTPVAYLRSRADRLRSTNDLERTILALEGAGIDSRRFAGADLAAELRSRRDGDGSVDGQVNLTAFFVLAMKAAGSDSGELARSAAWLREAQNRDGGWGFNPGAPSDPDSSGATLQALAAAGSGGRTSTAGVAWLHDVQRGGGGWGLATTGVVNAQSTAWAVQGLTAAGDAGSSLRAGLAYLERLRSPDGHYRYSSASDQTPIWVTAQVLLAVEREALPLSAVPRSPKPEPKPSSNGSTGASPAAEGSVAPTGGEAPSRSGGEQRTAHSRSGGDPPRHAGGSRDRPGERRDPTVAEREGGGQALTRPTAAALPGEPAAPDAAVDEADGDAPTGTYVAVGLGVLALGAGLLWHRRRA